MPVSLSDDSDHPDIAVNDLKSNADLNSKPSEVEDKILKKISDDSKNALSLSFQDMSSQRLQNHMRANTIASPTNAENDMLRIKRQGSKRKLK